MKKLVSIFAVLLALIAFAPQSHAGTATANLSVSVTVDSACTATTGSLAFTDYSPIGTNAGQPDDGTGTIGLACTIGTGATVLLGTGLYASSGQSRMSSGGSNYINYSLFQDADRSIVWGSSGGTSLIVSPAQNTNTRFFTVYGRIPAGQNSLSGAYTDTVLVTLNF